MGVGYRYQCTLGHKYQQGKEKEKKGTEMGRSRDNVEVQPKLVSLELLCSNKTFRESGETHHGNDRAESLEPSSPLT
ncbi:hypothetical protein SODALDRAFT_381684 [Sodiomyces alkalinus F11]|uniref:Uncharacterized protein n=1 Tax=Sodiomyces alkalinus (strain CBS 110278 / VKM F-3762 / F11) TaxID=1314773 RepID=A0A3N2PLW9_SODAK|nr:hypothetical protein SODALDRAFT_381684 [Sodiomyces alkalinus F11]ROT35523.1 hypothetical protein SODALDRAFT_381684 [Sodiomyces alkalinus F11]